MIVTDHGDRWRLITQPDHARFSGELLRLWRGPALAAHPRRDEILFAAREHDNGWREADSAPRWNAAADAGHGRPHDFLTTVDAVRMEVWLRGTARFAGEHPYATLLIALHALGFSGRRDAEEEAWNDFVARLEERRDELLEETGVERAEAERDYRWLNWADTASLAACAGWSDGFERKVPAEAGLGGSVGGEAEAGEDRGGAGGAVAMQGGAEEERTGGRLQVIRGRFEPADPSDPGDGGRLLLTPLPLAGATRFRIPCRFLDKRPYAGDADFATALATARWEEMEVRVTAGG